MDTLDFLDGPEPAPTAAPTPDAAPATAEAVAPSEANAEPQGQPRGPDGKFAPKTEAAPVAAAEPLPPAIAPEAVNAAEPVKAPDGYVPVSVVQEMRREIQALKQQREAPQPRYQPGEEGYEEEQQAIAYENLIAGRARVQVARGYAIKTHGEETVNAALEWARERADFDADFSAKSRSADDPVAFAIEEHQYHQALGKLRDPQARANFMAFLSGQAPPTPTAAPVVVAAPPQPPIPTRSIASAPAAGGAKPGAIPTDPKAVFDDIFRN